MRDFEDEKCAANFEPSESDATTRVGGGGKAGLRWLRLRQQMGRAQAAVPWGKAVFTN